MNIFVTGSTGYIGNRLVWKLIGQGHTIHALCRNKKKVSLLMHPNIKIFEGDIEDKSSLEAAMQTCSQVYHVAAFARVWARDNSKFDRVNVVGAINVFNAARAVGIERTVFTSSAGVLGPSVRTPIAENDPRIVSFFHIYEESKHVAELHALKAVSEGQDIVIVNPTRVFGPGVRTVSNAATNLMDKYSNGKFHIVPGNGCGLSNFAFIDDVVNGHIQAMECGKAGERYILGGENISYNQLFDTIDEITGRIQWRVKVPVNVLMIAGWLMNVFGNITGVPPLLTHKWIRALNYNLDKSCAKAQAELGYTITPFAEAVALTLDWLGVVPEKNYLETAVPKLKKIA